MCVFVQEEKESCGLWVVGSAFLEAFLRLQVFLGFEKFLLLLSSRLSKDCLRKDCFEEWIGLGCRVLGVESH
jgi:hypothetical protein